MALSDYPKESNALLTQEEKVVLDDMPDEAVKVFLNEVEGQQTGRITTMSKDGVSTLHLETPERVVAVKEYFEMMFEFGVRDRPE